MRCDALRCLDALSFWVAPGAEWRRVAVEQATQSQAAEWIESARWWEEGALGMRVTANSGGNGKISTHSVLRTRCSATPHSALPSQPTGFAVCCYRQWCFYLSTLSHGLCRGIYWIFNSPSVESRCLQAVDVIFNESCHAKQGDQGLQDRLMKSMEIRGCGPGALKLQHIEHLLGVQSRAREKGQV